MKKKIKEAGYTIEDKIRRLCGEITPEKRLMFILVILLAGTIANVYFMFSSIYKMGKKDAYKEQIKIEHITIPQPDTGINKMEMYRKQKKEEDTADEYVE